MLETTVGKLAATAVEANGTFVVRAGSYAQDTTRPGIGNTYREKRDALHRSGIIVDSDQPGYWKFAEDTPFDSLSAAAAVIQGYNVNGRTAWRISGTQQTYKDWQTAQIAAAGISSPNSTSNGSPATLLLPST